MVRGVFHLTHNRAYKVVRVWNVENGQQQQFESEIDLDWRFSADSRLLALTAMVDRGKSGQRSVGEIWDVTTAKRLKGIEPPREWRGVNTVAFSPDAKMLAIGGYKKFGVFSISLASCLPPKLIIVLVSFRIQSCRMR